MANVYERKCLLCGHINKNLRLEETDGWMTCEHCKAEIQFIEFRKAVKIPIFPIESITKEFLEQYFEDNNVESNGLTN